MKTRKAELFTGTDLHKKTKPQTNLQTNPRHDLRNLSPEVFSLAKASANTKWVTSVP